MGISDRNFDVVSLFGLFPYLQSSCFHSEISLQPEVEESCVDDREKKFTV